MSFMEDTLALKTRPESIRGLNLPRDSKYRTINGKTEQYYPSPADWRNEVLYFLLPDRFSDGRDKNRPLINRTNLAAHRPQGFRWDKWAEGGGNRWQGGSISGIKSRLDYIAELGATAIWIGPIFKQRIHLNSYHGYGIQDFLEVDPHFGTRKDFVELVSEAHKKGIRIILDVIMNHSGHNWNYEGGVATPAYKPWPGHYEIGSWIDKDGNPASGALKENDGVWPKELLEHSSYTRAGKGSLGEKNENVDDPYAEHKRTDFDGNFRDFNFDGGNALNDLAKCFKYWIALADIDGFRVDTLKHISKETARNFCGAVKEFAANLGKTNFFIVGEIAGDDENASKYLDALELNMNAALDIGNLRTALTSAAKGLSAPNEYFSKMQFWDPVLGSHRNSGPRHVKVIDDHDHVFGSKIRFSSNASSEQQVTAAAALLLFTLGIPCIYYGTEQAFCGPEKTERDKYLPDFGGHDKYLRETMFGPEHPRLSGAAGLTEGAGGEDIGLPGFGAFGTTGAHCFDTNFQVFRRIKYLIETRKAWTALRYGRQYLRQIRNFGNPFFYPGAGEIIAWSRILDEEEILCVVNGSGNENRGADIIVDASISSKSGAFFELVANSAEAAFGAAAHGGAYSGVHPVGQKLQVNRSGADTFIEIRSLPPSEVLVLVNRG